MAEKSTWEKFFDAHAPVYEENVFTKNTVREVDFLLEVLELPAESSVLNAARMLRRYQNEDVAEGRFDPFSLVETNALPPREGMAPVEVRERAFVGTELILLYRLAGLEVVHLWGGTAGSWGRRPLDLDEYEIMLVARKPA
jgi:hypothetical protein